MKVLLFSNLYPFAQQPTRGTFNYHTFRAVARHCEVRVVAPLTWWSRWRQPETLWKAPRENQTGLEAVFPSYWTIPSLHALHGRAMYTSLRGLVKRIHQEFPFDAIFAAWAYPDAVAAARFAQDFGCPLVTEILGSDVNDLPQRPGLQNQIRWALQQSQRVVTVSAALKERVEALGIPAERVVVQRNGVDGNLFALRDQQTLREELGLSSDRPRIVYVGNFRQEKGVDVLIEAMYHLRLLGRPDVELLMVGDGELAPSLQRRVGELNLDSQVRFCGRKRHEEIARWIGAGDVFCLPSRREGCPNVILEALACGRPVVASRVGGIPELLNSENGLMATAEDAPGLANCLQEALNRPWDPTALRASVPYLSWDAVGDTIYHILQEAVQESGSRMPVTHPLVI